MRAMRPLASIDADYLSRNLGAGLVASILTVTYAFSYAAVMFAGELSFAFPYGVAMALITAAVAAILTATLGTIPFGIAGPDVYSAVPLAATIAAVAAQLPPDVSAAARLVTVLGTLTLATVMTGLGLLGLGLAGAAVAIRYVPYPVISGFIAATGFLIMSAAVKMVTDVPQTIGALPRLLTMDAAAKIGAVSVYAALIVIVSARVKHSLTLPSLVVLGIVVVYVVLAVTGTDLETARAAGWLFSFGNEATLWIPWDAHAWSDFDWPSLVTVLPDMIAVLAVTALALVMSGTTLDALAGTDGDLNRELRAQGISSLGSAALGGFVGSLSVSRSSLAHAAGADGRLAGVVCGLGAALVLLVGPGIVAYVPKLALAGLLLFLGVQFLWKWLVRGRREMGVADYLTMVGILVVVVRYGYVAGVAAGILVGCMIFAVRYAGTPTVKHVLNLAERRSNVDRSFEASEILSRFGAAVPILQLQGYLFFGSAHRLLENVKTMLPEARLVVLDFKLVSGLDSSAAASFKKMAKAAAEAGATLVFSALPDACRRELQMTGVLDRAGQTVEFASLDAALEHAEEGLLEDETAKRSVGQAFRSWLHDELGSPTAAIALEAAAKRIEFEPGSHLCQQGEPTDSLLFVDSGRVDVVLEREGQEPLRLRSIEGRTVLGEMGFYLDAPRSASIVAKTPTVVYRLERGAYDALTSAYPAAAAALANLVIRLLSERLKITNMLIAAYER
jgi:SulP family sulfate permease